MGLRPYQEQAVANIIADMDEGIPSVLLKLPTGCGKTVAFTEVARLRESHGRTMVLAHRGELIDQAAEKIEGWTHLRCDIEMASMQAGVLNPAPVVVGSIQTQIAKRGGKARMEKFNPFDFGTLIIDEAHHAASVTYKRVINHYRQNPNLRVLGVTATPKRADNKGLISVFDKVSFGYSIMDAIADGWLAPLEQVVVPVKSLDLSGVKVNAGDFQAGDLERVLMGEKPLHGIAVPLVDIAGDRKAIVFAAGVHHAERLCEIINRYKPGKAAWVSGDTKKDDRKLILERYAKGEIQFLCNVGVLTEGFDDPGTSIVAIARPTKSTPLYTQMIGRGTRTLPNTVDGVDTAEGRRAAIAASQKPSCLIIDFAGNSGKHDLVSTADILGEERDDRVVKEAKRIARAAGEAGEKVDMADLLDRAEEEIEEADRQREIAKAREAAKRANIRVKATYKSFAVDPFAKGLIPDINFDKAGAHDPPTAGQLKLLHANKIDPTGLSRAQAGAMCQEIMRRRSAGECSLKQAALLERYGLDPKMQWRDARDAIDAIAGNGWKVPDHLLAAQAFVKNADAEHAAKPALRMVRY
jgi:superfamily II DNA or RNA helicase